MFTANFFAIWPLAVKTSFSGLNVEKNRDRPVNITIAGLKKATSGSKKKKTSNTAYVKY